MLVIRELPGWPLIKELEIYHSLHPTARGQAVKTPGLGELLSSAPRATNLS